MVDKPAFKMGDYVEKISGSSWRGRVVGTYSTDLTREGYAVESDTEKGSVQIYPAKALRLATPANGEQVERRVLIEKLREVAGLEDRNMKINGTAIRRFATEAADYLATLPTPTEDARSRVKVLEEALEAVKRAALHGETGKVRQAVVAIVHATALGNKETDRHG